MKRSIALRWAKALESGEYEQGIGQLRTSRNEFCCLGVLCNLHAEDNPDVAKKQKSKTKYMTCTGVLPDEVIQWADMCSTLGCIQETSLAELNDKSELTFPEIAKVIRKHWKEL